MDLALELGAGSVHQMLRSMPVDELSEWVQYSCKKALPTRRMELYLAQAAKVTAGGKLSDYLFFEPLGEVPAGEPAEAAAVTADAMASFAGGKVYYLKVNQ